MICQRKTLKPLHLVCDDPSHDLRLASLTFVTVRSEIQSMIQPSIWFENNIVLLCVWGFPWPMSREWREAFLPPISLPLTITKNPNTIEPTPRWQPQKTPCERFPRKLLPQQGRELKLWPGRITTLPDSCITAPTSLLLRPDYTIQTKEYVCDCMSLCVCVCVLV